MATIASRVDTHDPEYAANSAHYQTLLAELRVRLERVRQGGGAEAVARDLDVQALVTSIEAFRAQVRVGLDQATFAQR